MLCMHTSKKWFTLLEVIVAITLFFMIFTIIVSLYSKMMNVKYTIQAKQSLIQESHDVVEKINLLLKNYTIDYEEYFNRQRVGCVGNTSVGNNFTWNIGITWHCTNFSAYGNSNNVDQNHAWSYIMYYCSSQVAEAPPSLPNYVLTGGVQQGSGCANTWFQSFGEYAQQFRDRKKNVDNTPGAVGDEDDENVLSWPPAILNATGVQELYLISPDNKERIFLRRTLVDSGDWNGTGGVSGDNEFLYTIQILKLRSFDAWNHHDFDSSTASGVYDGIADTRACDVAQWFVCHGASVGTQIYSGYKLPIDADDGRVNLFDQDTTVSKWNLMVYPNKNPDYALAEDAAQISPYFTISLESKLYSKIWLKRIKPSPIDSFHFTLQTSFGVKSVYTQ